MVACNSTSANVEASDYKLYTCACTGQESCVTTDIDFHTETDADNPGCSGAADVDECKKFYMANSNQMPNTWKLDLIQRGRYYEKTRSNLGFSARNWLNYCKCSIFYFRI